MANANAIPQLAPLVATYQENAIPIDLDRLAAILSPWVIGGSILRRINRDDIRVPAAPGGGNQAYGTLREALNHGCKLFDGIIFYSLPIAQRPNAAILAQAHISPFHTPQANTHNDLNCSRYVAAVFLHLVSRANYPRGNGTVPGQDVPKFQSQLLNLNVSGDAIKNALANFDLANLDPSWVTRIQMHNLGNEMMNRLALGVAGYRLLQPFKLYECKVDATFAAQQAYGVIQQIANRPYSWNIHPVARNLQIIQRFGSLNNNLYNLILDCFTAEQITEMIQNKILPVQPQRRPQFRQYLTATVNDFPPDDNHIFAAPPPPPIAPVIQPQVQGAPQAAGNVNAPPQAPPNAPPNQPQGINNP